MSATAVQTLGSVRNTVGESPVWRADEGALYWVDIPQRRLQRWRDGHVTQWQAEQQLACIAPASQPGSWVAGMETGIFELRPQPDASLLVRPLASIEHAAPNMRCNDGRCDRQGRFWVGTMVQDMALASRAGALYRFDAAGGLVRVLDGLITPNGLAFSPDGRTMYLSDSHPSVQLIWAFDYDIASGTPSRQRVFVDMNQFAGRPDGAAVDAEGCYWICGNDAGVVHRFRPDGTLERSLEVPVRKPAMCAFGGPELKHLFVTSIKPPQPFAGHEGAPDGALCVAPLEVAGLPETPFKL